MRISMAIPALLLLGACQVSKGNNEVSVSYNQDVAENAAADIGNTAQNVAADIGNDVKNTGEKIQNKVNNSDLSVNVNTDVKTSNKTGKK